MSLIAEKFGLSCRLFRRMRAHPGNRLGIGHFRSSRFNSGSRTFSGFRFCNPLRRYRFGNRFSLYRRLRLSGHCNGHRRHFGRSILRRFRLNLMIILPGHICRQGFSLPKQNLFVEHPKFIEHQISFHGRNSLRCQPTRGDTPHTVNLREHLFHIFLCWHICLKFFQS